LPQLRLRKALGTSRRFNTDQFTVRIRQGETIIASSTTSGSSRTVNSGDTGLVSLMSGQSYTLDEVGVGATNLGNYNVTLACSNALSTSTTTLPTAIGEPLTVQAGDRITCIITNSRLSTAVLTVDKTSVVISDPVNGTVNPKAIPGAIIEYEITVTNAGARVVDSSSIVILDMMPANMAYSVISPVTFTDGATSSGLESFDAATMVTYSAQANGSGPFNYTPIGPFDSSVRGLRIAPAGRMQRATSAADQPSFSIRFRARVE
jgi:uncharacterized repeat protein (TIGR01451 family)